MSKFEHNVFGNFFNQQQQGGTPPEQPQGPKLSGFPPTDTIIILEGPNMVTEITTPENPPPIGFIDRPFHNQWVAMTYDPNTMELLDEYKE